MGLHYEIYSFPFFKGGGSISSYYLLKNIYYYELLYFSHVLPTCARYDFRICGFSGFYLYMSFLFFIFSMLDISCVNIFNIICDVFLILVV